MSITDDTKLVEIDSEADIVTALEILSGAALLGGNQRLYEHIHRAKAQYQHGVELNLFPKHPGASR